MTTLPNEPALGGRALGRNSDYLLPGITLSTLSGLLHVLVYGTIAPLVIATFFYISGAILLGALRAGGGIERGAFRLMFSTCWLWAGVAAIYANFLNDPGQNSSDAAGFFALASGEASGLRLEEIEQLTVGSGAVALWRIFYDLFSVLGFEKGRYIGITFNVLLVALTGITGVKLIKLVFGEDYARLRRFILLFSLCGMFWLFAAIHLRDAAVLLTASVAALYWVKYLGRPRPANLAWLIATSLGAFIAFALLRIEFVFVPLAMLAAGFASIVLNPPSNGRRREMVLVATVFMSALLAFLIVLFRTDLFDTLLRGNEAYAELAAEVPSATESLGAQFIVNAPLLARLILGAAYVLIFPIPVWSGLGSDSVYQLFKSLQALFMYGLVPLWALAIWRVCNPGTVRTAPLLFLVFVPLGMLLAVAGTSLETRHFGAFLVPVLVLATLPDLSARSEWATYRNFLVLFIVSMLVIHCAWAALKFL